MSRSTVNFSVRIDSQLHQAGEYLKSKHPRTVSHSRIYAEGLKSIIAAAIERGESIPSDPLAEIILVNEQARDEIQKEIDDLTLLQKKNQARASRTLAGAKPEKKPETNEKEKYVYDTFLETTGWYKESVIETDPERFKPAPSDNVKEGVAA